MHAGIPLSVVVASKHQPYLSVLLLNLMNLSERKERKESPYDLHPTLLTLLCRSTSTVL